MRFESSNTQMAERRGKEGGRKRRVGRDKGRKEYGVEACDLASRRKLNPRTAAAKRRRNECASQNSLRHLGHTTELCTYR